MEGTQPVIPHDGYRQSRPANIRNPEIQEEHIIESAGCLEVWDIASLIINKMIGTGIFITPATVVLLVGSKFGALLLWFFGSFYSFASILVYLEYGLAWPFTGGEFTYITKIFPRPALVSATSFAWFFVVFSTSTGNAINFAKFISLAAADFMVEDPTTKVINGWQLKFIACWIVVAVCLVHYRLIDIGVIFNALLAGYKVLLVLVLIVGACVGLAHESSHGGIRGAHDWQNFDIRPDEVIRTKGSPANVALAVFLVLYSYQGWENANYVTAEIEGNGEERRRKLKTGSLIAISIVSFVYIFFNVFLFLLLSNDDIDTAATKGYSVAYNVALHSFNKGDSTSWSDEYKTNIRKGIFTCIALSALGNLVGVIFTNGRVKREIARSGLIPGNSFFAASSSYGRNRDPAGTPTGGLVLHGLATCITIACVNLYSDGSTEGLSFIINLFTYGHSVLGIALGMGLSKLRQRLLENKTDFDGDIHDGTGQTNQPPPPPTWRYAVLKSSILRWSCAGFIILVNAFLVVLPMIPSNLPSGKPRRIQNWKLPAVVLPVFVAGILGGFAITIIATHMEFRSGTDHLLDDPYARRNWQIQYCDIIDFVERWRARGGWRTIWREAKIRLWEESEASHAQANRPVAWQESHSIPLEQVKSGPVQNGGGD